MPSLRSTVLITVVTIMFAATLGHADPAKDKARSHVKAADTAYKLGKFADALTDRRSGDHNHVRGEHDHQHAKRLGEAVHGAAGFANDEQPNGNHCAENGADFHIEPGQRVEAQSRAGDVADVERKPT